KEVEMAEMAEMNGTSGGDVVPLVEDTLVQMETSVVVGEPKTDAVDLMMGDEGMDVDMDVNGEASAAIMDKESEMIVEGMAPGI
ncbi:hypothetical protein LTS18_009018, partial [Coniosporium uncinatum]